jgi:hypothetical protein
VQRAFIQRLHFLCPLQGRRQLLQRFSSHDQIEGVRIIRPLAQTSRALDLVKPHGQRRTHPAVNDDILRGKRFCRLLIELVGPQVHASFC